MLEHESENFIAEALCNEQFGYVKKIFFILCVLPTCPYKDEVLGMFSTCSDESHLRVLLA